MPESYVTIDEIKTRLVNKLKADQEDEAIKIGLASSRAVDDYLSVTWGFFSPVTEESLKRIRGSGNTYIYLPLPLSGSVEIVAPPGFTVPNFTVEDNRLLALTEEGYPSDYVIWNNVYYDITGVWGFPEIPAQIKEATLQLFVHFYRGRDKALTGTVTDMRQDESFPERDYPRACRRLMDEFMRNLNNKPSGGLVIM